MYKGTDKFSFFQPPITNTTPAFSLSVEGFFKIITGDGGRSYKAEVERLRDMADRPKNERNAYKKRTLPFVTPHGTFTSRESTGLVELSGLFVADLDCYGEDMSAFMLAIKADPYVRLAFVGPSGEGSVKIFFRIDAGRILATDRQMEDIYWAVEGYLRTQYAYCLPAPPAGATLLDKAAKDLPRACFLSYDPDAHMGPAEGERIDADFIARYSYREKESTGGGANAKQDRVDPAIPQTRAARHSLDALAEKHLKVGASHHDEILSFMGAALRLGHTKEAVHVFLRDGGWISSESGESDPVTLERTIEDVWKRWGLFDPAVEIIREGQEIAWGCLRYRHSATYGYRLDGLHFNGVLRMLEGHGFCRRAVGQGFVLARKQAGVLEEMTKDKIKTFAQEQIESMGSVTFNASGRVHTSSEAIIETFLRSSHNLFNDQWLGHLRIDRSPLLRDTRDTMSFPFRNKIVTISAKDGIVEREWGMLGDAVVWKDQIIPHNFAFIVHFDDGVYATFMRNVTGGCAGRLMSAKTGIGYMLHHHFNDSEGQAVLLYDETITDINKPMGGSGKGVFVKAIKVLRKTAKVDGKHFDAANRFRWEAVGPDTQVVWIDDAKKDFDFSLLHSNLTDGWTIERKFQPQILIPPADSPKTIIASNSIIKGEGTTNKRRQFIIEIGDYYSSRIIYGHEKPIEEEHGGLFFSDAWPEEEWNKFFSFMLTCGIEFLKGGLHAYVGVNIERNRLRQRTGEDFVEWAEAKGFALERWYEKKELYNDFKATSYGDDDNTFKQRAFTKFIQHFAESRGWVMEKTRSQFRFLDPFVLKTKAASGDRPEAASGQQEDLPF